ncbi:MAG TPA: 50S ribosomal protein L28 [Solirubrobacteraceae bacterium]|nr:50S ribosomal protein L28 [Solirubrobacteraceae bacterium]
MGGHCQVTGRKPRSGNHVSHSQTRTKRWFKPNVHRKRFWLASESRFVELRVSAKGMKVIDKRGIETVVREMRARGEKV